MRIEEDLELENLFAKELLRKSTWVREGTHRGDVTRCMLKTLYGKMGLQPQLDPHTEMVMGLGRAHHIVFEVLEDHLKEFEVTWNEIINTLDLYKENALEIKTSRMGISNEERLLKMKNWIEQLKSASIATGKSMSRLFYVHIISGIHKAWQFHFKDSELQDFAIEIIRRRNLLWESFAKRDPKILLNEVPRYEWECWRRTKHRIVQCRWKHVCIKWHPDFGINELLLNKYDRKLEDAMAWIQSGVERVDKFTVEREPLAISANVRGEHSTYALVVGESEKFCGCIGAKRHKIICRHGVYLPLYSWIKGHISALEMRRILL